MENVPLPSSALEHMGRGGAWNKELFQMMYMPEDIVFASKRRDTHRDHEK